MTTSVLPAQAATLAAPGSLAVANKNSSTPILSWAKVTMNKKKTKATIDAKKRFKPGTYLVHATTKIKDLRGNPLAGGETVITSR